MCAKLVLSRGKYDSAKQALFDRYWLPIKARIKFKILTTMFNCGTGCAPTYMDILQFRNKGHNSETLWSGLTKFMSCTSTCQHV